MSASESGEKKVSWAELFFDLVFVVAVTRVSALLEHDHSWAGLLRALIVFVPIYWLWVGTAIQTNLQDTSRPLLRIRILAIALAGVFMALALPDAYGHLGLLFALSYWLGRVVLGAGIVLAAARARAWPVNPYSVSLVLTGPMLIVGTLVHGDMREALWGAAALLDLSTPTLLRSRLRNMHYDAGHLTERFGLFVLIALGESVVSVWVRRQHLANSLSRRAWQSPPPSCSAAACGGCTSTSPPTRCATPWKPRRCSSTSPDSIVIRTSLVHRRDHPRGCGPARLHRRTQSSPICATGRAARRRHGRVPSGVSPK